MSKKAKPSKILCRVRWWDTRDENGIAVAFDGNEYYISIDVVKDRAHLKDGQFVELELNDSITTTQCGKNVVPVEPTEQVRSLWQIQASILFGQKQFASALKQIARMIESGAA